MSKILPDDPENDSEGDWEHKAWVMDADDDRPQRDLNQCPECRHNLDFSDDDEGFCWSCDL